MPIVIGLVMLVLLEIVLFVYAPLLDVDESDVVSARRNELIILGLFFLGVMMVGAYDVYT